jgi:hypothetical protein
MDNPEVQPEVPEEPPADITLEVQDGHHTASNSFAGVEDNG